jgi:hypothetical protein
VAFAKFLQSGEFIYLAANLKNKTQFKAKKLTCSNYISLNINNYAILQLKRNKTNYKCNRVNIIIAITRIITCLVIAL